MNTNTKGAEEIDRDLRMANRLSLAARHQDYVVDVKHMADDKPMQVPYCPDLETLLRSKAQGQG